MIDSYIDDKDVALEDLEAIPVPFEAKTLKKVIEFMNHEWFTQRLPKI